ncbi:MAG: hypothetical protein KJI72_00535 [Patescibacteria group bacterium]|nr:hypothetical protein [Patescibacteria group bacterium]
MFKQPKEDARYSWTAHSFVKMRQYGISESRIKRIIRYPQRTEEGIALDTVAVMQSAGTKRYQEVWVMYKVQSVSGKEQGAKKLKIITAWRYPGKSPERDPIPQEVIEEVRKLL